MRQIAAMFGADSRYMGSNFRARICNETLFTSLANARFGLDAWRDDYNHLRPHSKTAGKSSADDSHRRSLK